MMQFAARSPKRKRAFLSSTAVLYTLATLSALIPGTLFYLAWLSSQKDDQRATERIVSNQTEGKEEILAGQVGSAQAVITHQKSTRDEIIDDQQKGRDEIIQAQQRGKEDILAALKANKSLIDKLWEKYPFGFVLYGGQGGGSVNLPFYSKGIKVDKENWEYLRMHIDRGRKEFHLQLPPFQLEVAGRLLTQFMNYNVSNPYELGKPCGSLVKSGGAEMVVEIIDDNEYSPIWVIGIR